jgi:hypothetical protein
MLSLLKTTKVLDADLHPLLGLMLDDRHQCLELSVCSPEARRIPFFLKLPSNQGKKRV